MNVIEAVSRILVSIGAPYALIGGRAVAARGFPRMTLDYDFLTADQRVLSRDVWTVLERDGATVEMEMGAGDHRALRAP